MGREARLAFAQPVQFKLKSHGPLTTLANAATCCCKIVVIVRYMRRDYRGFR